jgi:hypothetical protein
MYARGGPVPQETGQPWVLGLRGLVGCGSLIPAGGPVDQQGDRGADDGTDDAAQVGNRSR